MVPQIVVKNRSPQKVEEPRFYKSLSEACDFFATVPVHGYDPILCLSEEHELWKKMTSILQQGLRVRQRVNQRYDIARE